MDLHWWSLIMLQEVQGWPLSPLRGRDPKWTFCWTPLNYGLGLLHGIHPHFLAALFHDSFWRDDAASSWASSLMFSHFSTPWSVAFASYLPDFFGQDKEEIKKKNVHQLFDVQWSQTLSILENRVKSSYERIASVAAAAEFGGLLLGGVIVIA